MTDRNIKDYLKHVATIGPCFLLVYPSSAAAIARRVELSQMPRGLLREHALPKELGNLRR